MMDSLGMNEKSDYENATQRITDLVDNIIHKFSNHPSTLKIKNHYQHECFFHFQFNSNLSIRIVF